MNRLIAELCENRLVRVGYSQSEVFKVDRQTNEMIKLTASAQLTYDMLGVSYPWEQLSSFFQTYHLTPLFYDCNGSSAKENEMVNPYGCS